MSHVSGGRTSDGRFKVIGYAGNPPCLYPIALIPLNDLKPHESIIEERVRYLIEDLVKRGVLVRPILVDSRTLVILDGHHRVEALKRLGKRLIPGVLADYDNDACITVDSWREGLRVTKGEVRERGLKGYLYPPRTSRHKPHFEIPDVNVPLTEL